jgi:hypothetical protein
MASRTYQVTVDGELGDYVGSAFPGMTFTHGHGTTSLTGELRDQTELQGVLQRVSDLGLTLLETKVVEGGPEIVREPVNAGTTGLASVPPTSRRRTWRKWS